MPVSAWPHLWPCVALGLIACTAYPSTSTRPPTALLPAAAASAAPPAAGAAPPATEPADAAPAPLSHPFQAPMPALDLRSIPAGRYARMSSTACTAEAKKRQLSVQRARRAAAGVAAPVELTGALQGVRFSAPGGRTPFGVLDCRLALALDDAAQVLGRHGVIRVQVDSYYRPHKGRARPKRSQHARGLAADVVSLTLGDERTLVVDRDWRGKRGEPACGPDAMPVEPTEATIALRNIVCDLARDGVFHHILTPNYDAAHESHLHLDIQRDAKRASIH